MVNTSWQWPLHIEQGYSRDGEYLPCRPHAKSLGKGCRQFHNEDTHFSARKQANKLFITLVGVHVYVKRKSMWKACEKQKPCEIKVGNTTADIHIHVKFSVCIWKLFWNFFNTCEIFFTQVKQFFIACEILFHSKISQEWNKFVVSVKFFHTRETILSCMWIFLHMWNNLVMHVKFFHAHELHVCQNFFTHGKQFCHACNYKCQGNAKHSRIRAKWLWKCTLLPSGWVHWARHTIPANGPSAMRPVTTISFISIIGMCLILQVSTSLFCLYFCNKFKWSICYNRSTFALQKNRLIRTTFWYYLSAQ